MTGLIIFCNIYCQDVPIGRCVMLLLSLLYFILLYVCCLGYMSSPATEDSLFCAVKEYRPEPSLDSELFFLHPHSEPMGLNWFSTATFLFTGRFASSSQGKTGQKFSGNTGSHIYTFPISISQGGIAIFWLRFGTGSPGNWGSHGPPNLGQILDTFQMPPKNTGGRGKFFSWGNT